MAKIDNKKVRQQIFNKYGGHCAYCADFLGKRFTIDHIQARSMEGKDEIYNYNPCCYSCNSSKSSYSLEQWRQRLESKYDRLMRGSSHFRILSRFRVILKAKDKVIFYFEDYG